MKIMKLLLRDISALSTYRVTRPIKSSPTNLRAFGATNGGTVQLLAIGRAITPAAPLYGLSASRAGRSVIYTCNVPLHDCVPCSATGSSRIIHNMYSSASIPKSAMDTIISHTHLRVLWDHLRFVLGLIPAYEYSSASSAPLKACYIVVCSRQTRLLKRNRSLHPSTPLATRITAVMLTFKAEYIRYTGQTRCNTRIFHVFP